MTHPRSPSGRREAKVDEKPSLLSAVLDHVGELRRVEQEHVMLDGRHEGLLDLSRLHWLEALGSHHILEQQLASLLENALGILRSSTPRHAPGQG